MKTFLHIEDDVEHIGPHLIDPDITPALRDHIHYGPYTVEIVRLIHIINKASGKQDEIHIYTIII